MRVGFVGLGIMGRPMALNLLRAGHELQVWGRREEAVRPLLEAGARRCASPGELARACEAVFTMVADTPDVEQVILGADGIITGAAPGCVVVDMSTVSPEVTRTIADRLRDRGVDMLDAPVSGGESGAVEGTLSIMVGGERRVFVRLLPLLEAMGRNIVHVGGHGAGQVAKACNQVLIAQTIAAVGEALILARAAGVDPARVREALLGGFAYSRVLETHGRRMLEGDFRPGFKARLHRKDMRIALDTARELGVAVPGAALATQWINALVGEGQGEQDSTAMVKMLERLAGVRIAEPATGVEH